jgi:hypothetical protein
MAEPGTQRLHVHTCIMLELSRRIGAASSTTRRDNASKSPFRESGSTYRPDNNTASTWSTASSGRHTGLKKPQANGFNNLNTMPCAASVGVVEELNAVGPIRLHPVSPQMQESTRTTDGAHPSHCTNKRRHPRPYPPPWEDQSPSHPGP